MEARAFLAFSLILGNHLLATQHGDPPATKSLPAQPTSSSTTLAADGTLPRPIGLREVVARAALS